MIKRALFPDNKFIGIAQDINMKNEFENYIGKYPCHIYSHVKTVGMSAVNMRKSIQKKRQPALLYALLASFPMPKYSRPIRIPTAKCENRRKRVKVWKK